MLGSTTRLNQTEPGQTSYNQSKSDRSSLNETKPEYRPVLNKPTPTRPGLKPEQITTEQGCRKSDSIINYYQAGM